jgi:hypothetical protein
MTTAEHEACHAVACMLLGVPYAEIDTVGDGQRYAGWVKIGVGTTTLERALRQAMVTAAPAAREEGRTAFE